VIKCSQDFVNDWFQNLKMSSKELSIKDSAVRRKGFVQCGQAGRGGSSDANVRTFWCKKTPNFSKFMVCPNGQGCLSQCGHFFGWWGSIFRDFVWRP